MAFQRTCHLKLQNEGGEEWIDCYRTHGKVFLESLTRDEFWIHMKIQLNQEAIPVIIFFFKNK